MFTAHGLPAAGPSLEELKAAIMRFVSPYMWEHEAFVLKRHEDAPCPWIERSQQQDATTGSILWAQFRHEGSIEDEWFTVFLLSYLTDRFKVCTSDRPGLAGHVLSSLGGYPAWRALSSHDITCNASELLCSVLCKLTISY